MPQIQCKDMTERQNFYVDKYMRQWHGDRFKVMDDVVVVYHASTKTYQDLHRRGYIHETFAFYDDEERYVRIKHEIAKKV